MATVNPVSTYSHAEAMVPDDIPDDEGYAQSTEVSYVTSLASSICRGVEENGRTYASYAKNVQGVPIDSEEQDRNDLQHAKFFLLLGDRLHLSPVPESVSRILDIGTGTGIWAMDMADRFPAAQVIGTDVAAVQPNWVPPNCQFEIEDAEDDWLFEKNYFDFIHARELLLTIHDWPRLIAQSYECLQPGGYLELGMTYPRTCCDDGSLDLKTSYFRETADLFYEMAEKMGAPIDDCRLWKDQMMEAGFVDVQEVVYPIPTGPWPKEPRLKKIGTLEIANLLKGYEGLMLRGFTQFLGRSLEEMQIMIAKARQEVTNPRNHAYIHYCLVYGRKPQSQ